MSDSFLTKIEDCIRRHNSEDSAEAEEGAAAEELLEITMQRLRAKASTVFRGFYRLRAFEETDDIFQTAMLRVIRRLKKHRFASSLEFFQMTARELRRACLDMIRHYFGPQGAGANLAASPIEGDGEKPGTVPEPTDSSHDPVQLAKWTELHRCIEDLPTEERQVVDLLYYHEMTQKQAGELLGKEPSWIKRRWLKARLRIQEKLNDSSWM